MKPVALLLSMVLSLSPSLTQAAEELEVHKVAENVYALVGPLGNRTPENLGNNATFGLIVTSEGAVLIDSGGSAKGAERIAARIAAITDQPVKLVINTGGQDHRWLGNSYFKGRGARIIASERAVQDQKARAADQLQGLTTLIGTSGIEGTVPAFADETFTDHLNVTLGGTRLEIYHVGQAHTPGDAYVWLPEQKVVFSGDIVYVDRMLGVSGFSNSGSWVRSFESMAALQPAHLVPGHGPATSLARATEHTYDYLTFLRAEIGKLIRAGGGLEEVGGLDQSRFRHLLNYEDLKGRNAHQVYLELEWQ